MTMIVKRNQSTSDDLSYWNVKKPFNSNDIGGVENEEHSIALSMSLLMKHRNASSSSKILQLPSHVITSPKCQCHRSFHIFCTDLFPENDHDTEMINIQPAPHCHDRDLSRQVSTTYRKYCQRVQDDTNRDVIGTMKSELNPMITSESQRFVKKSGVLPKVPSRTASHSSLHHSLLTSSIHGSKSIPQLQIHAIPVFDPSSSDPQIYFPRTPPPSPKTPTQDSSRVSLRPTTPASLQVVPLVPRVRNLNEKKLLNMSSTKIPNYDDSVREYLSSSDSSDDDRNIRMMEKPKLAVCTQPLSRPGTAFSVRLLLHNAKRRASVAKVHYSSSDVQRYGAEKSRRIPKPQSHSMMPITENPNAKTMTKLEAIPQRKSVFGFTKTASSMHFGFAAGRLGLQGSFEKWPRPLSRRTSIERKQEVTTLRLVTLPLVTS